MKLVSMKKEGAVGQGEKSMPVKMEADEYPYGLKLCLCEEDLKKLGIAELPEVGQKLKLSAVVEVSAYSINESKMYGEDRSLHLQVTEMGLSGVGKVEADAD